MDDLQYGIRNKRGDWAPKEPLTIAPIYRFPWKATEVLTWFKDYLFPWAISWMVIAAIYWFFLIPRVETMQTLAPGWIAYLFLLNCAGVLAFFGAMELRLYLQRRQGNLFKFNGKFPGDNKSNVFMFKSQAVDGGIRTFGTGIPIWTAYEVLILWCYANGYGAWTTFSAHPIWFVILWLLIPAYHEFHFYCIHRPLHSPLLYKYIHSIHHNSVNPSPWSSLSMHPIEQLLFFSSSLLYLVVPAHPLFALFHLTLSGYGSIVGHIGFDKMVFGKDKLLDIHTYNHYLHHKYFEVNYGDGVVPLDRVFGTYHDGTKEADELMDRRMQKRRAKLAAKASA
jgi:sterol desaturase/sphingolipid hydroxylase (fatty acid hydroxylase superfamily)